MLLEKWCSFSKIKMCLFDSKKILLNERILAYLFLTKKVCLFLIVYSHINWHEKTVLMKFFKKFFPANYNFEVEKSIFQLIKFRTKKILMQFPDGLQKYGINLIDLLKKNSLELSTFLISSRTSFGACCAEDFLGKFLGICLILHYGHSCLIPILECSVPMVYIFLEIGFDYTAIADTIKEYFSFFKGKFSLFSTIQYVSALKRIKTELKYFFDSILIHQNKPLSPGEILGCTSFNTNSLSNIIYVGDGRFHLEATIVSNPLNRFFQFNPFSHKLILVEYNSVEMFREREKILLKSVFSRMNFGIIFGILGKQGNVMIINRIKELILKKGFDPLVFSMTEISSDTLEVIGDGLIDIWTQIACPRLSTDWGYCFAKPFLNSYELAVLFCFTKWKKNKYKLDFYSHNGGFWANYVNSKPLFIRNL
nr:diphthamide biosynthesis protein 1 [Cryptomonas sp.]